MLRSLRSFTVLAGLPLLAVPACLSEEVTAPAPDADMATAAATTSRIAFLVFKPAGNDHRYDIYTMIPDGSGVRQLTSFGSYDGTMDWAPGATKLVDVMGGDIQLVSLDRSPVRNLTNTSNASESHPVWSPDGSKIVYGRGNDIYFMNANGSGQRNLTRTTAGEVEPRWSPDGRKIVYISSRLGNSAVHVMNADGSGQRRLTDGTSRWESGPVWSPDGRQIAFTAARGEGVDVYVINPDGSGLKNASYHPAGNGYPFWSPNSAKIAFSTNRKGSPEIYLMGRYGGSKTNLTQTPAAEDISRGWSPGGARILYQIGTEIWVMNADGSNKKRIYQGGRDAVWSH